MQNNMIKNVAGSDAKIISPWHYGHHGENAMFYKTLFLGTERVSPVDGVFASDI